MQEYETRPPVKVEAGISVGRTWEGYPNHERSNSDVYQCSNQVSHTRRCSRFPRSATNCLGDEL